MSAKRKIVIIAACLIISAIIIVVCVECFGNGQPSKFDGTLVKSLEYCI